MTELNKTGKQLNKLIQNGRNFKIASLLCQKQGIKHIKNKE